MSADSGCSLDDQESSQPPPAPIDPQLLSELVTLVQLQSRRRYVAMYPISFQTVAVNDGRHISVLPRQELHAKLTATLRHPQRVHWLMIDAQEGRCWICDVEHANEYFRFNEQND